MSAGFRAGQANDGYLQINGTDILAVSSGVLGIKNTGAQSEMRLFCESSNAHYASLKAPPHSDFIGNVTFTLPGTAGSSGQVLQTDGSGNLSWANNSGGGGGGVSDKMSEGNTEAEVVDTGTNGHFKVTTEGDERFRINSAGEVGINNTSPENYGSDGRNLVIGNSNSNAASGITLVSGTGGYSNLYFADGENGSAVYSGTINYNHSENRMDFWTNGVRRLRINSSGEIVSYVGTLRRDVSTSSFTVTGDTASNTGANINLYGASHSSLANIFRVRTGATERFRVGPSGQIGLGGANYGTTGQVLTSNGPNGGVSWTTISGGGGSYGNSDVDNHLNSGGASSGQILSWNGSDYAWVADQGGSGGGGISDVVDDTTPQLGGNLDLNSKNITGTGIIDITGNITASGNLTVEGSGGISLDSGAVATIQKVGGNIELHSSSGSVHLHNSSGQDAIQAGGDVRLYSSGNQKLTTLSTGVTVTGTLTATTFSGSGASLTSLPSAQLTGALPAISGANLTNLPGLSNVVEDTTPQLGGNLDVQAREINTSTSNGNIKLAPNGTGVVEVRGAGGSDGTLQLNCSAQSHGIKLKSPPHSAAASYTLTFPDSIVNGQYLKTDASGNLSWGPGALDQINEGNTTVEVVDTGSDGHIKMTAEGTEALRIDSDGHIRAYGDAGTSSIADAKAAFGTINAVVPSAGGTAALNVLSRGSGTQENIIFRSISTDGWAGAQFRAEDYNFTIRTTNVLTVDFNGSAQFKGKNRPSGLDTRISQYGSLLVGTSGELISNARCAIDSGNGDIKTIGNGEFSINTSTYQTGINLHTSSNLSTLTVYSDSSSSTHRSFVVYDNGQAVNANKYRAAIYANGNILGRRLFLGGSTNGGFDYNSTADTLEFLTTNGGTHSELNSTAYVPSTNGGKHLGHHNKRWDNVFCNGVRFDGNNTEQTTLDDYEEGTFIPTIAAGADDGSGGTPPFSIQAGRYIKIGKKVHCDIFIRFANGAYGSGAHARIGNLPFSISNDSYGNVGATNLTRGGGVSTFHNTTSDITTCYGNNGSAYFYLYKNGGTNFYFGGTNNANLSGTYWIGIFEYISNI